MNRLHTALLFLIIFVTPIAASVLDDLSFEFVKVADKVSPAVVTIRAEKVVRRPDIFSGWEYDFFGFRLPQGRDMEFKTDVLGSGVLIEDGYILTNNHVVENVEEITVHLTNRHEYKAEIIGRDPKSDIAVLRIDGNNLPEAKLGDSDKLQVGQWVLAIGNPFSDQLYSTVTHGIISALGRSRVGLVDYEDFIQTDAAINPGNSGGALVNLEGEVIGINSAIASRSGGSQGVGFAIPVNLAKRVMKDLIENGRVIRGYLGVQIQEVDYEIARSLGLKEVAGALIADVVEDTPADKAGLKTGDLVLKVDGKKIHTSSELRNTISARRPGDKVTLMLVRDGKEKYIDVTLEELPENLNQAMESRTVQDGPGFSVQDLDKNLAARYGIKKDEGVIITEVQPGSEAAKKGLRPGDIIIRVGDEEISSVREFDKAFEKYDKGDTVLLLVQRKNLKLFVALTIQ
ncbi:MAG: DegQ family serine endoprotease [Fidelibacterota bacterium]